MIIVPISQNNITSLFSRSQSKEHEQNYLFNSFLHYFIEVKIEKFNEVNYELLWYFIATAIIINILYPIFIIIKWQ